MNLPVANWRTTTTEGILLFHDLQDAGLRHYGPKAHWGQLTAQEIGNAATILSGLVDLSPTPEEIKQLLSSIGGRLAPLVASASVNALRPTVDPGPQHELRIMVVPALPFPQIMFRATLKHTDPAHATVAQAIQKRWEDRTLLAGGLRLSYAMRKAFCAYDVWLRTSEVRPVLAAAVGSAAVPAPQLYTVLRGLAAGAFGKWILDAAPKGMSNGLREEVTDALAELLGTTFFRDSGSSVSFDNGRQVKGYELHDALTLHPEFRERLAKSQDVDEDVEFFL